MFCDRCGTVLADSATFCSTCGKPAHAAPAQPVAAPQSRVSSHIRLLAILWLAVSVYRLLPGLFLFAVVRPVLWSAAPEVPFLPVVLKGIGGLILTGAVLGLITGWGLLERQPWARMLAIVLAFISLLEMPLGTALGGYTLWVLLPAGSEEEYRRISVTG